MTGSVPTLLADPAARKKRQLEKRNLILRWLRCNTWSTSEVLREVVGLASRQAVSSTLGALVRDGMLRRAVIHNDYGAPVLVWGITAHGAAMAATPDECVNIRLFESSKVNPSTLAHTLDLQRAQFRSERAGWRWLTNTGEFSKSEAKYADAVAIRQDGQKIAIEIERTVKTAKRYAEILVAHLAARKEGKWEWIYYLSPDEAIRDRVKRLFMEIHHANWHGRSITITDTHRSPFVFYTYKDDWTS
jgi:hypothetical protein